MGKFKMKQITKTLSKVATKRGSTVLTIISVVGVAVTAYLSAKAVKEAEENVRRAKEDKAMAQAEVTKETVTEEMVDKTELTSSEKFVAKTKAYWKPVLAAILTMGAAIGSHYISMKQVSDWMATANVATMAKQKYKEATEKVVGKEKAGEIQAEANKEMAATSPALKHTIYKGTGDQLFYDPWADRFFWSTISKIQNAVDQVNLNARNGVYSYRVSSTSYTDGEILGYVTLNDFYDELCLEETNAGEYVHWYIHPNTYSSTRRDDVYGLDLTDAEVSDDLNKSYIIVNFRNDPDNRFDK